MRVYLLISAVGITSIVIACVLCAALAVFLGIFFYKRRFKSASINLRKTYDTYHLQLTTDCKNMVNRLKVLGEYSDYFAASYQERQKQYDEILNRRDKDVETCLSSLDTFVKEKNYKEYKALEGECNQSVRDFEVSVCNFNGELTSILQEDTDVHSSAVVVKGKYRNISSFYQDHETELKPLDKSFERIFQSAEKGFDEFDGQADYANFADAKKVLERLDKLFDAVLSVLDKLPLLEVSVDTVLPDKLNKLQESYQQMLDEGFIVYEMHVEEKIADMRERVKKMQAQLMYLDIRGIQEEIQAIQTEITDVLAGFDEERRAKETYFSKQNSLSDSSFGVEKRYARMMNQLSAYQRAFVLDNKYVSQMQALKADIESIGILKRELDSYLDTSARQPYLVITRKMTDMDNEMNKAIRVMDDYDAYLSSLKNDSNEVFMGLRECYVNLKKARNIVKEIDVPSYTKSIKDVFTEDFQKIEDISKIVLNQPIDVPKAVSLFKPFKESVEGFISSIVNAKAESDKAETSIVYANFYRVDYSDSRALLDQAEKAFSEGDFQRASGIALDVVKRFSPTA